MCSWDPIFYITSPVLMVRSLYRLDDVSVAELKHCRL
jgi:hypothetical protein